MGKPLYNHTRPGFDSPWRSYQQISLSPRAVRPTQLFVFPRSANEYWIIMGLTPGHRRWGLLLSTTSSGMTGGYVLTIPGRQVPSKLTRSTKPRFRCAQIVFSRTNFAVYPPSEFFFESCQTSTMELCCFNFFFEKSSIIVVWQGSTYDCGLYCFLWGCSNVVLIPFAF